MMTKMLHMITNFFDSSLSNYWVKIEDTKQLLSQSTFGQAMAHVQSFLPLASSGMDWLVPALVGAVFGTAHYLLLQRAKTSTGMEVPMKR
ncbi:branched-chain amino acid transport system II carrier protein [Pediococcus acidilactici]|uniref:branched-chain amino acid transport system II carrier protein n=3 Tax=Pediococcus acidilactici TaxID=1254 RepID=UPI001F1D40A1|nr:branched-chain amino acid transport system II carrier protein [Pediococcus acidilactici]